MHEVVFLDRDTLGSTTVKRPSFPHRWTEHPFTPPELLIERAQAATILIVNKARIQSQTLAELPRLQLIAVAATGTDLIDLEACRARGVAVTNIRGYAARTVPEHVFSVMLALRRSLLEEARAVRDGAWSRSRIFCLLDQPIRDLEGAKLGIVGFGSIGQGVARIGRAFGMEILIAERPGAHPPRSDRIAFDRVLEESDVLTLHCPLTEATRGLLGAAAFARMKRTAILINTARGALVDDWALLQALREGRIAGAAIDVLSEEPPQRDHPLLCDPPPRLLVTPHVAWASEQAREALADQLIEVIEAFVRGEATNRIV